jgi:hypothetical protein
MVKPSKRYRRIMPDECDYTDGACDPTRPGAVAYLPRRSEEEVLTAREATTKTVLN